MADSYTQEGGRVDVGSSAASPLVKDSLKRKAFLGSKTQHQGNHQNSVEGAGCFEKGSKKKTGTVGVPVICTGLM